MKFIFMYDHRFQWPLTVMARVLGVSRQGYASWMVRLPSERFKRHRMLLERIREIHDMSDGSYGSPRMTDELRAKGIHVAYKTIERLMRIHGIRVTPKRRFRPTTDSSKTLAPAANLLERDFSVTTPNRVWLSDFTELPCRDGKAYAVAIMDLASRRILGVNVHNRMHTGSLMIAFHRACSVRKNFPKPADVDSGTIFHSDRGSQYNADGFRAALRRGGFRQSMSGVGNCYDNAPMESFWARMKTELRHRMPFRDVEDALRTVYRYIHLFYNNTRRHSGIGGISPAEFEGRYLRSICHST